MRTPPRRLALLAVTWLTGCPAADKPGDTADTGVGDSGADSADSGDTGDSGAGDSGGGDSGAGDSGAGDSGAGDSGAGDSGDTGAPCDEATGVGTTRYYADDDGDGAGDPTDHVDACEPPEGYVTVTGDCDDADPTVQAFSTWYTDDDGDGYGNPATASRACHAGAHQVADATDCDDADAATNPAAAEVCGGDDDDCDGLVDDADDSLDIASTAEWYADADGDGHYGYETTTFACARPDGHGTFAEIDDCDDGDAAVYPGAPEVCGNGVDDDCDGTGNACELEDGSAADAPTSWIGESPGDLAGAAVTAVDLDADGTPEVLLGAPSADTGTPWQLGAVYVVTPDAAGPVDLATAAATWQGTIAGAGFGARVAAVGDRDGDGWDDVLVTAPYASDDAGAAWLYAGGATWPTDPATELDGSAAGVGLGAALAGGEDLDDDGVPDAVLGLPGDHGGAAWVWTAGATLELTAVGRADGFGGTLAVGDVTGDGVADLLVGAPDAGDVYWFEGPVTASVRATYADDSYLGAEAGGAVAVVGDVDGDGYANLAISVTDDVAGVCGSGTSHPLSYSFRASLASFTHISSLAGGDLNGDGIDDLVVGDDDPDGTTGGSVDAFYGPVDGTVAREDGATLSASGSADRLGAALWVGDLDGDGLAEVLAGAPAANAGGLAAGVTYLFPGSSR